jgi:hypothetical protein
LTARNIVVKINAVEIQMNATTVQHLQDAEIAVLQAAFSAITKYAWIIPVTFGVPGNILTLLVASRKHNRKLSPCVYMSAMAGTDTVFLLEITWYYSVFYRGLLDHFTVKSARGFIVT